ncbi:MAG: penicillin-binding protein activator [Pseudomonadales bacterium]
MQQAKNSSEPRRSELYLQAASLLMQENQNSKALETLDLVDRSLLNPEKSTLYIQLRGELLIANQQVEEALNWLSQQDQASPQTLILVAKTQSLRGRHIASAALFATAIDRSENADQQWSIDLWQILLNLDIADIEAAYALYTDQPLNPWLSLAIILKNDVGSLQAQQERLQLWLNRYTGHAVAEYLPAQARTIQELNSQQHIAVLLPLQGRTGNAGKTLRDGISAAYLADTNSHKKLVFYNTAGNEDISAVYTRAVTAGADAIIGPLLKDNVRKILSVASVDIPILALNVTEPAAQGFQMGLASSDETSVATEQAAALGYQTALIVSPNTKWGEKLASEYRDNWEKLGGTITNHAIFEQDSELSDKVKTALNVTNSEQRANKLKSTLSTELLFQARRRQDIDAVFIAASPAQARSIKPILAFHFAGDLPVYATSTIYTGYMNPARDSDLNGIHFAETPWALTQQQDVKRQINLYIAQGAANSKNLYAMGIDAYNLLPRLSYLRLYPAQKFTGYTGSYAANGSGILTREPDWAQFSGGRAIAAIKLNTAGMEASNDIQGREEHPDTKHN